MKRQRSQKFQRLQYNKKIQGKALEANDLVRVYYGGPPPRDVSGKLISRWKGPYVILEKISDMNNMVNMPYYGRMVPRVVHFRNLFKVGELKVRNIEEVDLDGILLEDLLNKDETHDDGNSNDDERESETENVVTKTRASRVVKRSDRFNL